MQLAQGTPTSILLYDTTGDPVAYVEEDSGTTILYRVSGDPLAYVSDGAIYTFNGKNLGWYEKGVFYDRNGYMVAFSENNAPTTIPVKTTKIDIIKKPLPQKETIIEKVTLRPTLRPDVSSQPFGAYVTVEPAL